jgi:hypothetical protein
MTKHTSARTHQATASVARPNYYNTGGSYAPAITGEIVPSGAEYIHIDDALDSAYLDRALQARDGADERTNPLQRSQALVVRLLPFTAVWLVLAVGLSWLAAMGGAFGAVLFAGLTAVTYARMDWQERQFSRNGLERHRIDTAADLRLAEMEHQQELRRMAMRAHLKMLGVNDDLT